MAEYIEREAAIASMCRLCSDTTRDKCCIADICNHVCRLEAVPAADVRPVVRGRWIIHNEIKNVYGGICIECPKCGEKYVVEYVADEKFCRNCGCDMRETDEARRLKKQIALNELGYPYDLPKGE